VRPVGEGVGQEVERVETDVRRLLDHRPRRLLPLVPFRRHGPHDVGREPVYPGPDLELVLVELE
jgi:hypothetical protein